MRLDDVGPSCRSGGDELRGGVDRGQDGKQRDGPHAGAAHHPVHRLPRPLRSAHTPLHHHQPECVL
eukprot:3444571-Pyramimonas_sp.AAC.1